MNKENEIEDNYRQQSTNGNGSSNTAFPIVGIGASAGGLEAVSALLSNLPTDLGMAYIIVQHLSRDHESYLPELLEKATPMRVEKVKDGIEIKPDHVYVIPPATFMTIIHHRLILSEISTSENNFRVIDHFLQSLAAEYKNNAIAVILSGAGSDGTKGVEAIKYEGGITFTQDDSAQFSSMSIHAAESGFVDFIMSPEEIAKELTRMSKHPYPLTPPENLFDGNEENIKKIHDLLFSRFGIEFSNYKEATINRRMLRRMALNKLTSLEQYIRLLRQNAVELELLYRDILINVTHFFRDVSMFSCLTDKIFPALFKNRNSQETIRIWVPACSTGEEACSIGICMYEFLASSSLNIPIQIFATDVSEIAIEKARTGIYSKNALQNVSPERLKKFFIKTDGHYQIIKPIRDMCVFAKHNLLKDPPFSKIDLISCQNVLIYLSTNAQRKVIHAFHFALKPSSYLILGKSETIGSETEFFDQLLNKEEKVYIKKDGPVRLHLDFISPVPHQAKGYITSNVKAGNGIPEFDIEKEADKLLLTKYIPASVLISKDLQIIRFTGQVNQFLHPAHGKASLHLMKMLRDELVIEVQELLHRTKKQGTAQLKNNIPITDIKESFECSIEVSPIKSRNGDIFYLIVFRPDSPLFTAPAEKGKTSSEKTRKKIETLEEELRFARQQMKTINEEFEGMREELQSSNEEVLSSNEELQSINEELETSKEELQSTNEELTTINDELQARNAELKESIDYVKAILETMRTPFIVLDQSLRIRTANRSFYELFNLTENIEGQQLYMIADRLMDIPEMRSKLERSVSRGESFYNFEVKHDFGREGQKILLLNAERLTGPNSNTGTILLAFEDITERKNSEQSLHESEKRFRAIFNQAAAGITLMDLNGNFTLWNERFCDIIGYKNEELQNKNINDLTDPQHQNEALPLFANLAKTGESFEIEKRFMRKDKNLVWVKKSVSAITDDDGKVIAALAVVIDINIRKLAEEEMRKSEERLRLVIESARDYAIFTVNGKGIIDSWSPGAELVFGYKEEDILGMSSSILYTPEDNEKNVPSKELQTALIEGSASDERWHIHKDGSRFYASGVMNRISTGDSQWLVKIARDLTEKKLLEQQKDEFIGIASHELKTPVTSIKAYAEILEEKLQESGEQSEILLISKLHAQVDRLTRLISDLLDVTKITEGQMQLDRKTVRLNEILQTCVQNMQPTSPKHKLVLDVEEDSLVSADIERIEQVMINLISNAIKYSPKADRIIINSNTSDNKVTICVKDFGIGMTEETMKKVFERFFRANDEAAYTYPGLGLGLFIAADIIKKHGGEIWVESKRQEGSVFCFSLPVLKDSSDQ